MNGQASAQAVNMAILAAHRLGEPRVLELSRAQLEALRLWGRAADWAGPPWSYRGLRVAKDEGTRGRVLAWDRAREREMVQLIRWPQDQMR